MKKAAPVEVLSESERDVIECVLQGAKNGEIATRRGTSSRTVAHQIARAFKKLGVGSRGELGARMLATTSCRQAATSSPGDPVGILEAAYRTERDDAAWLTSIATVVAPVVRAELGVAAYLYDASVPGAFNIDTLVGVGCPDGFREAFGVIFGSTSHIKAPLRAALRRNVSVASEAMGSAQLFQIPGMADAMARIGVRDFLRLVAEDPSGFGCVINAPLPRAGSSGDYDTGLLAQILAHISAGFRLRRRLRPERVESEAEAVLDDRGRVLHAEGAAKEAVARDALGEGVRQIEKSRGSLRARAPREAVANWRALVKARWTLLEGSEGEGRRLFRAQRNDAAVPIVSSLTAAELQVATWAALGHSNKLIAYELGLAESTVAMRLSRAYRKLSVRSRVDLIVALATLRGSST